MSNKIKHLFNWQRARDTKDESFIPHKSFISFNYTYRLVQHVYDQHPQLQTLLVLANNEDLESYAPEMYQVNSRASGPGEYRWCELAIVDEKELDG